MDEFMQECAKQLVEQVYGDLAKGGVSQVGKALETVAELINTGLLMPVKEWSEKRKLIFEHNLELFRAKLEQKRLEEICPVSPELGVPIIEKLSYITDKTLSDMFAELLASASKVDSVQYAHPSFVNVISNLSPDEARILQYLKQSGKSIPFIDVRWELSPKRNYHSVCPILTLLPFRCDLRYKENDEVYIRNLVSLGILKVEPENALSAENDYKELVEIMNYSFSHEFPNGNGRLLIHKRGLIRVTALGEMLMQACVGS